MTLSCVLPLMAQQDSFGDTLTRSSSCHVVALIKVMQTLIRFFLLVNSEDKMFTLSHRYRCNKIISVIHLTCRWF